MIISNKIFLGILSAAVKIKFLSLFIVLLCFTKIEAQSVQYTTDGIIFTTKDAIIFSDNIEISGKRVVVNSKEIQRKKKNQNIASSSEKNMISKSLIKKKKTIAVAQKKPTKVFSDTQSNHDVENDSVFGQNISIPNQNPTFKSEFIFYYRALNISIYVHLEKIYAEEFSLHSEFSKSFFSRPPPSRSA